MTMREAKEIFLKYDCSYFSMCMKDFAGYIEYRRVEVPLKHENHWRNKKATILYRDVCATKDYLSFYRLYKTLVVFWDSYHLKILLNALEVIKIPAKMRDKVGMAEIMLGSSERTVNRGMIRWAYIMEKREIEIFLFMYVYKLLENISSTNIELEKRIRRSKCVLKKLEKNGFDF